MMNLLAKIRKDQSGLRSQKVREPYSYYKFYYSNEFGKDCFGG